MGSWFGVLSVCAAAMALVLALMTSGSRRLIEERLLRIGGTAAPRLAGLAPRGRDGGASAPGALPAASGRVEIETISERELAAIYPLQRPTVSRKLKRAFDLAAAVTLLVAVLPLMAVTALAVRLDSPGPVLYRQRRVGLHGRVFEVYKFRSMKADAERDGARWANVGDDRITRVGRVIRKLRIDELPQLINIVRGEMSFVGPRPERPEFVETLRAEIPNYDLRHLVKPGLTGWAQVSCAYGASVEDAREKLRFDLFYLRNYSPVFDVAVVLLTVRVALFGLGAR